MLTEIVLWSDYYDTIISPFYNYSTGVTKGNNQKCKNYILSISAKKSYKHSALDADKKSLPAQTEAVDWQYYGDDVLYRDCYSIAIEKDNYQILIPDEFF